MSRPVALGSVLLGIAVVGVAVVGGCAAAPPEVPVREAPELISRILEHCAELNYQLIFPSGNEPARIRVNGSLLGDTPISLGIEDLFAQLDGSLRRPNPTQGFVLKHPQPEFELQLEMIGDEVRNQTIYVVVRRGLERIPVGGLAVEIETGSGAPAVLDGRIDEKLDETAVGDHRHGFRHVTVGWRLAR